MTKDYKPGDRVRMIKDTRVSTLGKSFYKQGEEYIVDVSVMGMFSDYDLKLEHSEYSCGYVNFEDVELVTEFTLSDIKTGMLVKTGDGVLRICIGNTLISAKEGGLPLSLYNEDLSVKNNSNEHRHKIIKLYEEPQKTKGDWFGAGMTFWLEDEHFLKHTNVLWEYKELEVEPEPEVEELTISEIETRLGISNLKIVGEQ